jgi:phosphoglycerate dehydrogenase-like enzyme
MEQRPRPTVVVALAGPGKPPGMDAAERLATVRYAAEDRLADDLPGADVLLVWNMPAAAVIRAWPKADELRWVHLAGAGVEALASAEVPAEVAVTNSRGLFDQPIAEYVLGLVLAFAKELPARLRLQQARGWERMETERVTGKQVLVAGTGSIGRAIGRALTAAGLRVTGIGRIGRSTDPDLGQVLPLDRLVEALRSTDYLVLAAPLTQDTRGMLDGRALAAMRSTARVINVGRGGLLVMDDLVRALRNGRIAGVALDVFPDERPQQDSPLWELPNVLISPHMSGQVVSWREDLVALFVDNLNRFVEGRALRNVVDPSRLL